MARTKRRSRKAGLPPGTLVHVGEKKTETTRYTLIRYDESSLEEKVVPSPEACFDWEGETAMVWINVDGIHDVDAIHRIGELCRLHPLTLEDVVNTEQRAKFEIYEEYVFVVLKMIEHLDSPDRIRVEQVSLVLKPGLLISFQEREGDVFNALRDRLRHPGSRLRKEGSDYLAYGLMDSIVDHYFVCLEKSGEQIENLQEKLLQRAEAATIEEIHRTKREMIYLRRAIWPLREVINAILRGETGFFTPGTLVYLRDVYDHTVQVIDTLEIHREMLGGMMDIYLSSVSNRLNEVMKMLTIIATIFIPLTFIAGVYGMNFKYMPELEWPWGYPAILLVMLSIALVMLLYFRRKRWL